MKKFLLLILSLPFAFQGIAQVTLLRSDYPLAPDDTVFSRILLPESVALPEEGPDQTWDYTNVAFQQQVGNIENAGTHPDFPTANIVESVVLQFVASISQETHFIEQLDESGHRILGREVFPAKSDLSFLTGSPFDSLNFLRNVCVYAEPLYLIKFPLNYQDTFSSAFSIHTPFELTLPILNFQQAPSVQIAHLDYQYEVSSWGTLTLPNPLVGGGQKSFDALLLKRTQTRVDSFYLDSMPANPGLLSFFRLEQGQTTQLTNYSFWVKGLNRAALSFTVNEQTGNVVSASMSRDVNNFITTSNRFIDNLPAVKISPNPARNQLQVEFKKTDIQDWTLTLFNTVGQAVYIQKISAPKGAINLEISLNTDLPKGIYHLLLKNGAGAGVHSEKLILSSN